jgi:hypothetical protein
MTINEQAKQIRTEVSALKSGRGRKYTKALRERVLSWMECAIEAGMFESEASKTIGVPLTRIDSWRKAERELMENYVPPPFVPRATETTALVPVSVRDDFPFGSPAIAFSTPSGYRVEGLSLDQALGLLRAFA